MPTYAIGVDLGGTNLRIAAVDEQGTLLEKTTLGAQISRGRDFVIGEMCDAIRALSLKLRGAGTLKGIGIGVPGIIEMATGTVVQSPNLPDWRDYPARQEIERRLGSTVILENDANAAALGEKWLGAARDCDSMLMFTLGTGVGGGLVLNGRVWHGMNGMAGEVGHITVEPEGHPCGCGNRGCIEQYASATAVVRMAGEAVANSIANGIPTALRDAVRSKDQEFSAKVVYQLAVQGDAVARSVWQRVGRGLGLSVAAMVNILNLHMYVIGGGVSSAWEMFAPAMFDELKRRSYIYATTMPGGGEKEPTAKQTIICRALLGSDAGLFGAARLPMVE